MFNRLAQLVQSVAFRARGFAQRHETESDLDAELDFHIQRETTANVARGLAPHEARRVAMAQFGGVERFKEECRDERRVRWLEDTATDVRHGLRLIGNNKLFSAAVIGTLALGIGATSTIFTIVNGVLLRPLPYPAADRIIAVGEASKNDPGGESGAESARQSNIAAWQQASSIAAIASYSPAGGVLTGTGEPITLRGGAATASLFSILGVPPELGRTFDASAELIGSPSVILLSHALWQTSFGGDSTIVNKTLTLNGTVRTIVGVMPERFEFPLKSMYWVPMRAQPIEPGIDYYFDVLVKLRDGVSLEGAQRELQAILTRGDSTLPPPSRGSVVIVNTVHDQLFGSVQKPLTFMLGAVVMLLLVACANVANLTLARATTRQREFAVRLALGASQWRLIRQLLVESSLLAGIGGAVGMLAPVLLVDAFVRLSPKSVAGLSDFHVDGTVLVFAALSTGLAALLFGLAPAFTGSTTRPSGALAAGSTRASSSKAHSMLRSSLVVAEIAAALMLITGAALLTKSFARALAVNPGFRADNVYAVDFQLPSRRYADETAVNTFYSQVADRIRAMPGVERLSVSSSLPLNGFAWSRTMRRFVNDAAPVNVAFSEIDSAYGPVVGLHLVKGRYINGSDVVGAPLAAMLTSSAAHALFPDGDALGRHLFDHLNGEVKERAVVVGIVDDVPQLSVDQKPVPQIFLAAAQSHASPLHIIARTSLDRNAYQRAVKSIVSSIDPLQPITQFRSMREELAKSVAPRRFNSILINAFAGIALILALIGLYGLMAHAVIARTRELGIRMALGASRQNVMRLVLRQGVMLTGIGIVAGVALSFALARTLSSLLYDVGTYDVTSFVVAPVLFAAVACVACYIPARRATQVNPMVAIRTE